MVEVPTRQMRASSIVPYCLNDQAFHLLRWWDYGLPAPTSRPAPDGQRRPSHPMWMYGPCTECSGASLAEFRL